MTKEVYFVHAVDTEGPLYESLDAKFDRMSSSHITAWKLGLKTGIYYFRTKPGAAAIKFTIDNSRFKKNSNVEVEEQEEECLHCSA